VAGSGAGGTTSGDCAGSEVAVPKRLVRLSFNQIANAVRSLTDETEAAKVAANFEIGDSEHRTFPPLVSPREGSTLTDKTWGLGDKIAAEVGSYALSNLATFTSCGADPTEECARTSVLSFAERAFRRALSEPEKASLLQALSEITAAGGTPAQLVQFGVYAALEAPQFLYRTEFGADAKVAGVLSQNELANQLSFFLTDAPPDATLLQAAEAGMLSTPEQIKTQVARILAMPVAKQNLQDAMFSYFGLFGLETVVVDSPDWNDGVRNSMYRESGLFLANNLWTGTLAGLLTTRTSAINATLAPLYGVTTFPPPGAVVDGDGFAQIELPDNRAGMLTQSGFLTARSRPDLPSVVGRGLLVNAALLCAQNPAFPASLAAEIASANSMLATASEREKANFRAQKPTCASCHSGFDPYGLALGNFDSIGRFTTADPQGRAIDASVVLPAMAGGAQVSSAVELAQSLASGTAFSTCMAKNVMLYALAEIPNAESSVASVRADGCATRGIATQFQKTERTFQGLIAEVAASKTLAERSAGLGAL
jgi:hypothetical protein